MTKPTIKWAIRTAELPYIKNRIHVCLFVNVNGASTYGFCGALLMTKTMLRNFKKELGTVEIQHSTHMTNLNAPWEVSDNA